MVALEILHYPTKLQLCVLFQSKIILTHVNSSSYLLDGLAWNPRLFHFGYHKYTYSHMCL